MLSKESEWAQSKSEDVCHRHQRKSAQMSGSSELPHRFSQASVELGQDLDLDGLLEPATSFSFVQEGEKAFAEAKWFVAEALKPEEPD